jgi:pyruvate,orthophosphate dikinase
VTVSLGVPVDDVGLVPFGKGAERGLDARTLGTRGMQLESLAGFGLPVPPGVTVPVPNLAGLLDGVRAQAALDLLELRSGVRIGSVVTGDGLRGLVLLRVSASAPVEVAGLPPDLTGLGIDVTGLDELAAACDAQLAADLYHVWWQTAAFIAEHGLGVPGPAIAGLAIDHDRPRDRVGPLLELCASEGSRAWPHQPAEQLKYAATALAARWASPRAARARRSQSLPDDLPLAVHLEIVRADAHETSGYGSATSRDLDTGVFTPTGAFRRGIRGADDVGRTQRELDELPGGAAMLTGVLAQIEAQRRNVVTVRFEYTRDALVLVGVEELARPPARAATSLAVDLALRGVITEADAVAAVRPSHVLELMYPRPRLTGSEQVLATGLPASPGAASGRICLSSDSAVDRSDDGQAVVLIAAETTPADMPGMMAARAIVTSTGGSASHAAVVARGMGRPAVCGASALKIDPVAGQVTGGGITLAEGELVSVDGSSGQVFVGVIPIETPDPAPALTTVLEWADDIRRLGVRANADNAADAAVAMNLGAHGIGLCRTEHQFLGDRLPLVRRVILAHDADAETQALAALADAQRSDFRDLLRVVGDRPITVRLLDAPMHEFLPASAAEAEDEHQARLVEHLQEHNPMLGVRGVRLAMMHDGLYPAQAEALFSAWTDVVREDGVRPQLEVMIPLVSIPEELVMSLRTVRRANQEVATRSGLQVPFTIGTMVETPRAALLAGPLARHAQFISFGTNDLTQLTYGFSRDDVERRMLGAYLERGLLDVSPFVELDELGVGALMTQAVAQARAVRPDIKIGICGEHGGDPASVAFCERLGLDYVSCSPHRVPMARLAAAHAAARPGTERHDK